MCDTPRPTGECIWWLLLRASSCQCPCRVSLAPAAPSPAFTAFFLGGVPTLKHREVISSPVDRFRLHTESSGEVNVRLCVVSKDLSRYGVTA
jgi:hypothetical protein